jgi:conjugal transfer pilus assembly protein TraA
MNRKSASALVLALVAGSAFAANNTDATFQQVYDMVDLWLTGSLGKTIAIAALAVGLGIGIVKQSILAVVIGISMALALALGPGVISGVFNAVL